MSVQDVLRQYGIRDPDLTVRLADAAGLSYAAAGVVLMKESGGGRNVWGHDGVNDGGIYTKGSEVDQATYERYRSARSAGRIGSQGVGPVQLTWHGFQDEADRRGGCWNPEISTQVGFESLAGNIRAAGVWHAALTYNGAASYADDFMAKHHDLSARLANQPTPTPTPTPTPVPEDEVIDYAKLAAETAQAILDTPIPYKGDNLPQNFVGKNTSLRVELEYLANNVFWIIKAVNGTPAPRPLPVPTPRPSPTPRTSIWDGWGSPADGAKFDGNTVDTAFWGLYGPGPGNGGNGRRVPSAFTQSNGTLTITGGTDNTTGGAQSNPGHTHNRGRWAVEMQVDSQGPGKGYHAVAAVIPQGVPYLGGARDLDFAEFDSGTSPYVFLHYITPQGNKQDYAKGNVDTREWHEYVLEITDSWMAWYIDGNVVGVDTIAAAIPSKDIGLAPNIQLDAFQPDGMAATTMRVRRFDYYELPANLTQPSGPPLSVGDYK